MYTGTACLPTSSFTTLLEILNQRSASLAELGRIISVGQNKLARHGDTFLGALKDAAHFDK